MYSTERGEENEAGVMGSAEYQVPLGFGMMVSAARPTNYVEAVEAQCRIKDVVLMLIYFALHVYFTTNVFLQAASRHHDRVATD